MLPYESEHEMKRQKGFTLIQPVWNSVVDDSWKSGVGYLEISTHRWVPDINVVVVDGDQCAGVAQPIGVLQSRSWYLIFYSSDCYRNEMTETKRDKPVGWQPFTGIFSSRSDWIEKIRRESFKPRNNLCKPGLCICNLCRNIKKCLEETAFVLV